MIANTDAMTTVLRMIHHFPQVMHRRGGGALW